MFRDLLDDDGHILTHNFRPIQPLGDRIILFNIIDDDDNTLEQNHHNPADDIPSDVDLDANDDPSDLTNGINKNNVLNDSPDNNLDEDVVDSSTEKAKLDSGSTNHFVSLYILSMALLAIKLNGRQIC